MTEMNEQTVRAEVRAWLEANWDTDLGLVEWRNKLVDSGWGAPHWPSTWYGRDLPVGLVPVVEEEFDRIGAVGVAKMGIRTLAAATILAHGTDMHKEKFLRRILTGEDTWCQLFSEPGSGSDLPARRPRGDERKQMGRKRPKGLDDERPSRELRPVVGSDRRGCSETQRHDVLHHRYSSARR